MHVYSSSSDSNAAKIENPCDVSNQGPSGGTKLKLLATPLLNTPMSSALIFFRAKMCTYPASGPALSSKPKSASLWLKFQNQILEAETTPFQAPEDSKSFLVFPGGENQK